MSIYDQYEPTQEDLRVKELNGSNHHIEKRREKKKERREWKTNTMRRALDNILL